MAIIKKPKKGSKKMEPAPASKPKAFLSSLKRTNFSKNQLIIFTLVFAAIGGYILYHTFAASPVVLSIEAESMSVPAGTSVINDNLASGAKAVKMTTDSVLSSTISLPAAATSVTINAKADQCQGWPVLSASLDGKSMLAGTSVSSSTYVSYSATGNFTAGTHTLSLDGANTGLVYKGSSNNTRCSRSIYFDVVTFYGTLTAAPAVSLNASLSSVSAGGTSLLSWNSTNTTSCSASGAWSGSKAVSGTETTTALSATSTFTLTCIGLGGSASASTTVTVSALAKPSAPTGFAATAGNGSISLKWNPNPAAEQVDVYQVYRDSGADINLSVSGTTFTVSGLTNGVSYGFRVSAHNPAGYGPWTDPIITATPTSGSTTTTAAPGSYWGASSPFNTLIPASPQVRANYNTGPLAGLPGIGFNTAGWSAAFFEDEPNRPRVTVHSSSGGWITDNVPIPSQLDAFVSAMAAYGDGERQNDIVDGNKVYNLYGLHKDSTGAWESNAEGVLRYGGSGVWNNNLGPWQGRASGFASTAGAVRKAEVDSGIINHALGVAWPKDRIGPPMSPAVTSDGSCTSNCAPMGSRLQLDPTLTDTQLIAMGISSYYLPVAHAMQKYGAYIADSSSWMTIYAESWNNSGHVTWPSSGWYPASTNLVSHLRIVEPPAAPVLDDRTIFGQPHQ